MTQYSNDTKRCPPCTRSYHRNECVGSRREHGDFR